MKSLLSGHIYELDDLKSDSKTKFQFYMDPDIHDGKELKGPSSQEVIRMLIQRVQHLDAEQSWSGNQQIIQHLRSCIALFESRALLRKIEKNELDIETIQLDQDGHIKLFQMANVISDNKS